MHEIGQGLIVIGVNRSGTSALAAALTELGVYFGPPGDLPSNGLRIDYESFENRHIVEMGGAILREFERDGVPARNVPPGWETYADMPSKLQGASKFISAYFGDRPVWGWKDPRTSILIPFFESAFIELGVRPTYFMAVRHPMEVARGLFARQNLPIIEGLGHWIHYTLTALSDVDPDRLVLVPFREFVENPRPILEPIWASLGLNPPSENQWQRVRTVVRPELDRTQAESVELPRIAARLWALVSSLAPTQSLSVGSAERDLLDELAVEWKDWMDLTRLSAIPVGEVRWVAGNRQGSMAFSGERVWHTCEIKLPYRSEDTVDAWFLPRYRIVFLRNIRFCSASGDLAVEPIVRDGAFAERSGVGEFRVFAFGAAEHVSFPIPRGRGVTELRFELQVVAGKQGAMQNAHRLAVAYAASIRGNG